MPYEVWDALKHEDMILWVAGVCTFTGFLFGACMGAWLTCGRP